MTYPVPNAIRAELAAQFQLGAHSLHGPAHWATVETHAVRHGEGHDVGHGARGAALVQHYRLRLPLNGAQVELLAEACRGHEVGGVSADPTIGACWDADRLDLARVGMVPRPEFMSTAAGQAAARDRPWWLRTLAGQA